MAISNAVALANIASKDTLVVDSVNNKVGIASTLPTATLDVNGVAKATSFVGSGVSVTGVTATGLSGTPDIVVGSVTASSGSFSGSVSVGGTLTYEDVTNIDSVGLITARTGVRVTAGGVVVAGVSTFNDDIKGDTATNISGINSVTASYFYGDGSNLDGVVSGIELKQAGSSVGTSLTAINFASGATLTTGSGGISTITIAAGIQTAAASGGLVTLNLSSAQDHKVTATGITTITVTGGTEGDSHTVRIINSGIATVSFSSYFLWPSGSTPTLPTASGAKSLVSFTVNNVGAGGTELFAGASVNYS